MNTGWAAVSVCVIARDEENHIGPCLESVAHLAAETIVVDTGSVDRTASIAQAAGAKVFAFAWTGDFAAARNFASAQATGDWILVLDADERLEFISRGDFEKLLLVSGVEGYYVKILSYIGNGDDTMDDYVVRLFRRKSGYCFTGAIHEQVAGSITEANHGQGLLVAGLTITHFGYLEQTIKVKDKSKRNIGVIRQALAIKPGDPFLLYSLGIEYLQNGQPALACEELTKAVRLLHGHEGYFRQLLLSLGLSFYQAGLAQELLDFISACLTMFPGDSDFYVLQGLGAMANRQYLPAIAALQNTLAQDGALVTMDWRHVLLGDAYNLAGLYPEAETEYLRAVELQPQQLYPLLQLLGLRKRQASGRKWRALAALPLPCWSPQLLGQQEFPVAVMVLLLQLLRSCLQQQEEQWEPLIQQYLTMLLSHTEHANRPILAYLALCACEAHTYGGAAQAVGGCEWFNPVAQLERLFEKNLDMALEYVCPLWTPEPGGCLRGR